MDPAGLLFGNASKPVLPDSNSAFRIESGHSEGSTAIGNQLKRLLAKRCAVDSGFGISEVIVVPQVDESLIEVETLTLSVSANVLLTLKFQTL